MRNGEAKVQDAFVKYIQYCIGILRVQMKRCYIKGSRFERLRWGQKYTTLLRKKPSSTIISFWSYSSSNLFVSLFQVYNRYLSSRFIAFLSLNSPKMRRAKTPSRQLNSEAIRGATLCYESRNRWTVQHYQHKMFLAGMWKKGTSKNPGNPYARSGIFATKPFQVCFLTTLA